MFLLLKCLVKFLEGNVVVNMVKDSALVWKREAVVEAVDYQSRWRREIPKEVADEIIETVVGTTQPIHFAGTDPKPEGLVFRSLSNRYPEGVWLVVPNRPIKLLEF